MIHNDTVKTFDDIVCHLEVEDEHPEVAKSSKLAYVVESSSHKILGFKCKN